MSVTRDDSEGMARLAAFQQGLQQLGWTDGRNVRIDIRWAGGKTDDARRYAGELIALAPDVILAFGRDDGRTIATGDPYRSHRFHTNS
jgi:hypothetical protein